MDMDLFLSLISQSLDVPPAEVSWGTQLWFMALSVGAGSIGLGFWGIRRLIDLIGNKQAREIVGHINQQAEIVAGAAFDRFRVLEAASRAPESKGGSRITQEEWTEIKDQLWEEFKNGFGTRWVDRGIKVLGALAFQQTAKAALTSNLTRRLDERRVSNTLSSSLHL